MNMLTAVPVHAEGYNHGKLLSALAAQGIPTADCKRQTPREITFTVQKKDLRKTFAILQDMCYTYKVAGASRTRSALVHLLARIGFVAGILVFSTLVAFARGFVWRVEITGNETVPTKVIENVLAEHNIAVGKKLSAFDAGALSAAVRAIDGITLASVRRVGTSVQVEVFESDPAAPPLAYSETDIVSRYDATVTRVIAREGTALVRPGDHVFAATPLIGAYRKSTEEGAEPLPSRAAGIVYGRVTFTYGTTVATERYEYVPESTKRRTRLRIFGISIGRKPKGGEGYEITESRRTFNVFLPVTVITSHVRKMRRQKITATVDELAERAEAEALSRFIHSEVSSGIVSHRTVRDLGGGLYRVNVFVEAEMVIGGA